jgi:hypothetical protein
MEGIDEHGLCFVQSQASSAQTSAAATAAAAKGSRFVRPSLLLNVRSALTRKEIALLRTVLANALKV